MRYNKEVGKGLKQNSVNLVVKKVHVSPKEAMCSVGKKPFQFSDKVFGLAAKEDHKHTFRKEF